MICKNCGGIIKEEANFCEYCGATIEKPQPQQVIINNYYDSNPNQQAPVVNNYYQTPNQQFELISKKSRLADLIICILLGVFGGHKFYEAKPGMGILYLFTAGLCGIGWIIDIFVIACGHPKDGYGKQIKW